MIARRIPAGPLRPFVQLLWLSDAPPGPTPRERVLPTGAMHVVIRLSDAPLRVVGADGREVALGPGIVGGARGAYYVRDVSQPSRSIGAQLFPGACLPLLGVPAAELADRHVDLAALWGGAVDELRARLLEAPTTAAAFDVFEAALARRLPRVRGIDPIVAHAVSRFDAQQPVAAVVDETGYSHRAFLTRFRAAVGLSPKRYGRVRRMHRALAGMATSRSWAEIAADAGYADQAHLVRELRELAGVTPTQLRRAAAPGTGLHVPIEPSGSDSDSFKTGGARGGKVKP
jgi:AraC-like DNA-binding protein